MQASSECSVCLCARSRKAEGFWWFGSQRLSTKHLDEIPISEDMLRTIAHLPAWQSILEILSLTYNRAAVKEESFEFHVDLVLSRYPMKDGFRLWQCPHLRSNFGCPRQTWLAPSVLETNVLRSYTRGQSRSLRNIQILNLPPRRYVYKTSFNDYHYMIMCPGIRDSLDSPLDVHASRKFICNWDLPEFGTYLSEHAFLFTGYSRSIALSLNYAAKWRLRRLRLVIALSIKLQGLIIPDWTCTNIFHQSLALSNRLRPNITWC